MKNLCDRCLLGLAIAVGTALMGFNAVWSWASCPNTIATSAPCTSDTCLLGCPLDPILIYNDQDIDVECPGQDGVSVAFGNFATDSYPGRVAYKSDSLAPCTITIKAEDCRPVRRSLFTGGYFVYCEATGSTLYEEFEYEDDDCGELV